MKISQIILNNYKVYYKENIFKIPPDKKIIIIKGNNGTGKTTLLYSIIWCLYSDKKEEKFINIYNKDYLDELQNGEKIETYVGISFEHENKDYYIERRISYTKNDEEIREETLRKNSEETLLLEKFDNNAGKSSIITSEIEIRDFINGIINETVKDYFFFDATKIKEFMNEEHEKDVEQAIKNLLNIKSIEKAEEHLDKMLSEQNKKSSKNKELSEKEKEKLEERGIKNDQLNEINTSIKKMISIKNEWIEQQKISLKELASQSKYEEIKTKLDINEKNINNIDLELKEIEDNKNKILGNSYMFYSKKLILDAKLLKEENNQIITNDDLIKISKETLERKKCLICEHDLEIETIEIIRNKCKEMTENEKKGEEKTSDFFRKIDRFELNVENEKKMLIELLEKEGDKIKNERFLIREKKELEEEGRRFTENYKEGLQESIENIHREIGEMTSKITLKRLEKDNCLKELDKLENEITQIKNKTEINNIEEKKYQLLKKLKKEIENIFQNYETKKLKDINIAFKRVFKILIEKEAFTKVFIGDNYKLNINLNNRDENVVKNISDGEKVILSLSLIMALALSTDSSKLFMMDTPFEKLSINYREKVIAEIPKIVDQLFLIVTDSQIDDKMLSICEANLAIKFNLVQDSSGSKTSIEEEE